VVDLPKGPASNAHSGRSSRSIAHVAAIFCLRSNRGSAQSVAEGALMKLYGYFLSSAAFRVRIALNLKGLDYEYASVNLIKDQHLTEEFARVNPQQAVPTLVDGDRTLTQSLAIIEYLEEHYPTPPLLPASVDARARVRSIAQLIACDI